MIDFFRKSLVRQLILGVSVVHALLMTIFVGDFINRYKKDIEQTHLENDFEFAQLIAKGSTHWVLSSDFVGLEELISKKPAEIESIEILNSVGKVLAHSNNENVGKFVSDKKSLEMLSQNEGFIFDKSSHLSVLAVPIKSNLKLVGWVRLSCNNEHLVVATKALIYKGVLFTLLAIVIGAFLSWILIRGVTSDLNKITRLTSKLKKSFGDERLELTRKDELHQLATNFNALLDTIATDREKLSSAKAYADLALEGAGLGIWDWDLNSNQVTFDKRWADMLGLDINEIDMELKTWESRVHPDDLKECYAAIQQYMDGKTERYEHIHRLKHTEGHWVYILDRGRFSGWDDSGKPTRFTGTHFDISEKMQAENELRMVLKVNQIGLWKFNPKSDELTWDQSMYDLFEVNPKDFSGAFEAWSNTLHEDSKHSAPQEFQKALEGKGNFSALFKITTPSGEVKHVGASAIIERDSQGHPVFVTGMNWNRTKEQAAIDSAQKQMEILQHQAKLATVGELAAGVGHEINNPLAIIAGHISSISRKLKKGMDIDFETLQNSIKKATIAVERISKIVQGLRNFSRSDTKEITAFNACEAVKESYDLVHELYAREGIQIKIESHIKEQNSCTLRGNRGKFQQILMNLISNAKDAVKESENKTIDITVETNNDNYIVKVKDSGCGIPENIKNKIYNPFFTTKGVNEGTGIGLSLVHNFVKDLNGQLNLTSEMGRGTTFEIVLPMESKIKVTPQSENMDFDKKNFIARVLLVDDEPEVRRLLAELLQDFGLKITEASNGKEAFEIYQKNPEDFDLIITDMKMPQMDGASLVKHLRAQENLKQPKIIVFTGGVGIDFEDKENELSTLINGYFFKPFSDEGVAEVLQSCLGTTDQKLAG